MNFMCLLDRAPEMGNIGMRMNTLSEFYYCIYFGYTNGADSSQP
jgi:hypothetical protein